MVLGGVVRGCVLQAVGFEGGVEVMAAVSATDEAHRRRCSLKGLRSGRPLHVTEQRDLAEIDDVDDIR